MKPLRQRAAHFTGTIHGWPCMICVTPGVVRLRKKYGRKWQTLSFEQAWDACNGQGHFPLTIPGPQSETMNSKSPPDAAPLAAPGPAQTAPPAGILSEADETRRPLSGISS